MTYQALEQSIEDGQPVELYKFTNLTESFLYTSGPLEVEVGAETYVPVTISRENTEIGTGQTTTGDLVITMPVDDPFALRYVSTIPATLDQLQIQRLHSSDGATPQVVVYWEGQVASVAFTDNEAKVNARNTGSVLQRLIPTRTCSNLCGHILYDRGCKVSDSNPSFNFNTTVTAVSGNTVNVSGTGLSALASDFFVAGFLENGATAEQRMVLDQTDLGGDVLQLLLLLPFNDLSIGAALVLRAGCDHTLATCRDKFSNVDNHGGFPFVPSKNPFSSNTGIVDT